MARTLALPALLLALRAALPAIAQDAAGVDGMFDDPGEGIVEQPGEGLDVDALGTERKPHFSGSASVSGGFVFGLSRWENPFTDPEALAFTPFYAMDTALKLDVRPASFLRLYASFEVQSPYDDPADADGPAVDFSPLLVDELFLDYTLADLLFFRAGKQDITWGQGRLFNPGDFLLDAEEGIALKGFLPLGPGGLTLVGLGEGVLGPGAAAFEDLAELVAVAGLWDISLPRLAFGLSAYYRLEPGLRAGAYLKTPLAGVDVALEGVLEWGPDPAGPDSAALLTSLFWEGGRGKWQIVLEYLFDTAVPDYLGHSVGLAIRANKWLRGNWQPGLHWVHSFADASGQLLVGLEGPLAKYLRLRIGLPFQYGNSDGYYTRYLARELPGMEYLEKINEGRVPGDPAAALLVMLTLSVNF